MLLAELTREQIRELAPNSTVVLPTAAIEQHGPHLPIITDTLLVTTVAERSATLAAQNISVLVAPTLPYGISAHHRPFPGVLSLNGDTFITVLRDLGESLVLSGFRRIFILNGHGGNDEAIRLAARDIAQRHTITVGAASYWTIASAALRQEGQVDAVGSLPGHAGGFETALVRAVRPDLVQAEMPSPAGSGLASAGTTTYFSARGGANDGLVGGYTDDPARATAEIGSRFLDLIAREVSTALMNFHHS